MWIAVTLASTASISPTAVRTPFSVAAVKQTQLRSLYDKEMAGASARKEQAAKTSARLSNLGRLRDSIPLPVRLQPHDIPVITLESELTSDALAKLLAHEACAVHVKGYLGSEACSEVTSRLRGEMATEAAAFSTWHIHKAADSSSDAALAPTEVDKIGVTSGEALDSWESFQEYLNPSSPASLDALLPGDLNPFTGLRKMLDNLHPDGCRLETRSGYPLPPGTFRRMTTSKGLVHADTATLLTSGAGEFSANLYVSTPKGRGSLSVYPAMQYAAQSGITSPALLADLASLALRQSAAFDDGAQEALRAALPIKRTIELNDGDLVLINTGRFHGVEPYGQGGVDSNDAPAFRLSGQCWLSYREGKSLRMWV